MALFTPEELAELAQADAEIDEEFTCTQEELTASRRRDRAARLEALPPEKRKIAENKRAYYEANREKIAENQRAYYEANREKIAENQRAYREANREKIAENQRAYYEANREKIAENKRAALKDYRKKHGLSQRGLAKLLGVTAAAVSYWELGRVPMNMRLICSILPELGSVLETA